MHSHSDTESLGKLKAFANFTPAEVEKLAEVSERVHYDQDQMVFPEGAPSDRMFVILKGRVRVERGDHQKVILARLETGDFFGDLSLFDGGPRSAAVIAETPCEFLAIAKPTLGVLAGISPGAAIKLLVAVGGALASRLRQGNQKYFDLLLGCSGNP